MKTNAPDARLLRTGHSKNGFHTGKAARANALYVRTDLVKEVALRVREGASDAGIVVVAGANGLGKSVASRLAVEWVNQQLGTRVLWLQAGPPQQAAKLTAMLAVNLGIEVTWERMWWTAYLVGLALEEQGDNLIVAVDEAGYLPQDALGLLRDWHDHGNAKWTLLLVGNSRLAKKLAYQQPELLSRTDRYIEAEALTAAQSVKFAQGLHPAFARTGKALLHTADKWCVGGVPRLWVKALVACLDYGSADEAEQGFSADTMTAATQAVKR